MMTELLHLAGLRDTASASALFLQRELRQCLDRPFNLDCLLMAP